MKPARNASQVPQAGAFADTLNLMWNKFLPEIRSRAWVLREAAEAAAAGKLDAPQRDAAQAAAHKLAGTLGTFGLGEGTALARELENIYAGRTEPVPPQRLMAMAIEVQGIIDSRK